MLSKLRTITFRRDIGGKIVGNFPQCRKLQLLDRSNEVNPQFGIPYDCEVMREFPNFDFVRICRTHSKNREIIKKAIFQLIWAKHFCNQRNDEDICEELNMSCPARKLGGFSSVVGNKCPLIVKSEKEIIKESEYLWSKLISFDELFRYLERMREHYF